MVHELVHAYDECRGKDFDWTNCRHIACSEVCSRPSRFEQLESSACFVMQSYIIRLVCFSYLFSVPGLYIETFLQQVAYSCQRFSHVSCVCGADSGCKTQWRLQHENGNGTG